ncbi:MAG: drug/metabolite transporter (DMT)-like permease [Patiriisocius sp.]|jgi:drug/metabolite transporter (DMT)-like permease
MNTSILVTIIFTVSMSALAQVLLKVGALRIPTEHFTGLNIESVLAMFSVLFSKYIFMGMLIYVFSAGLWIWVLTKVDISLAYPFISFSFIVTLGFGVTLFQEPLTTMKILGTAVIIVGCFILTKS